MSRDSSPPPEVTIRPARGEDAGARVRLLADVAAERSWIATEPPIDPEAQQRAWRRSPGPGGIVLVALAGLTLVGELSLAAARPGSVVLGMMVDERWRGRGIGTRLLAAGIAWARERPAIERIELAVFPHNAAALRLYRAWGFRERALLAREVPRAGGEAWDVILMRLDLERSTGGDEA